MNCFVVSVIIFFRIMFGSSHLYLFYLPEEKKTLEKEGKLIDVTYEMAQDEIAKNAGFKMKKKEQSNGLFINRFLIAFRSKSNFEN